MNGLRVPGGLSDVTPCWLTKCLNADRSSGGPSVTGYTAEPLAEGKGFMSQLFRLMLHFDSGPADRPDTVIAKLPSADPLLRTVFDKLGQNRREVGFYRNLANSPQMLTPRVYHSALDPATGNTVLLLEDLRSLRQGDSVAGCTLDEARLCMEQLARFHASWWDSPLLEDLHWMRSGSLMQAPMSSYTPAPGMPLAKRPATECRPVCESWATI